MTDTAGSWYISVKAKEIEVQISNESDLDRVTYLVCTVRSMLQDNGQILNVYNPEWKASIW